jgi:hypothetical protein
MSVKTPSTIIGNLNFDSKIFDEIEKVKKYKQYIIEHNVPELVTFGKNYLI